MLEKVIKIFKPGKIIIFTIKRLLIHSINFYTSVKLKTDIAFTLEIF